ncbi:protein translocase subunit secF [Methanocorpusculum labreanum Z]|uniref:Protein-export membrane protein SecF n=1 Tax=Methanocorpusculum labreanum (strain ATCC 43576 / DSM 4855 / Z) TaxID=410358 RepID=A2SQ49_METLZ|nr:protein translocase subunit SecF [Methanocorpusculum labreanum]ABN06455.1 protein translocase subunit secF [Methanocorpusculum labreanum Z]
MKLPKYDINKYDPKRMMAIPAVLFGLALVIVGITFALTGMPVTPGIDFAGGTAVTIHTDDTKEEIVAFYSGYDLKSIDEGIGSGGYYLKFGPMSNEDMMKFNNYTLSKYPEASIDQIGANFGATLQSQAMWAILFAFIGMAVVVFLAFRKVIPAITVVSAGIADITITAAVMNLVGIELSLATTAALLMLIGYSVDSNILLTTKVLKRQGKLEEKMEGAFRTGIIMTTTTLAAIVAMFIVAFIGQVPTLYSIAAVLIIGLISDIIFTWGFNAGVLRLYLSGSEKSQAMPKQSKKDNAGAKQ